jgi:OmcA/MtrC family decaheme c-type cytochrome
MKSGPINRRILLMIVFSCLLAAFSVAAFEGGEQVYSALDLASYLAAGETVWIRPGLHISIIDVNIPLDLKPQVTFRLTDDQGQGLDKDGKLTPGTVSLGIILAYLPQSSSQYVSYSTRVQGPSPISGKSATQATTDSGGTYTSLGDGNYTYKFKTVLPGNYDKTTTHTLGIYASRSLTTFGMSRYVDNQIKNFVPSGSLPVKIRDVVPTAACNQCHDPISAHGSTGRQNMEICILCHTPQTIDPDTGNTVDMKVMTHKIHRGNQLPSVIAGKPYQIIGNSQSVNDYSTIAFPQDIRNCQTCHKDAQQVNNWMLKPTRETCGSCHDSINWETGENHLAGAQPNDNRCFLCHTAQGDWEYDASVSGAHTVPYKSTQLKNPKFQIFSITNAGPGQKPSVQFKITDKNGNIILPSAMSRLSIMVGGPTSDYRWTLRETATGAAFANGAATYNFTGTMPTTAAGSYAVEIEGYINATLNPGTPKALSVRDAGNNVVVPFAVTGTIATPRRTVVDIAKCNKCHDNLQLHGGNRNQIVACVMCHNPAAATASTATLPGESIDLKIMAHKIHTGENLTGDYILGSTNFNEVLYPGDRRDCLQCHVGTSYTLPLPATATSSTTPRSYWDPMRPTAAACLSCHDSLEAAVHALVNTASIGESCAVCHKETADFSVSASHAR